MGAFSLIVVINLLNSCVKMVCNDCDKSSNDDPSDEYSNPEDHSGDSESDHDDDDNDDLQVSSSPHELSSNNEDQRTLNDNRANEATSHESDCEKYTRVWCAVKNGKEFLRKNQFDMSFAWFCVALETDDAQAVSFHPNFADEFCTAASCCSKLLESENRIEDALNCIRKALNYFPTNC